MMFGILYMLLIFTFYATVTHLSGQGMRIIDFLAGQAFVAVFMIFKYYFGGTTSEQKSQQALLESTSSNASLIKGAQNLISKFQNPTQILRKAT
jgi:hypothetical protein